jgi:predicted nucleotidyltransferase
VWYYWDMDSLADPVFARLRAALEMAYGSRIERVVLFGSRARGEARPDSDYDIAVFLKEAGSFWKESGRLADIGTDILYDTGAVINALPLRAGLGREHGPLTRELARDGREL